MCVEKVFNKYAKIAVFKNIQNIDNIKLAIKTISLNNSLKNSIYLK